MKKILIAALVGLSATAPVRAQQITVSPSVPILTIGQTAIVSGTNTNVLYNNNGVLGQYGITGTGSVVMSASPTLTGTSTLAAFNASGNGTVAGNLAAGTASALGYKFEVKTATDEHFVVQGHQNLADGVTIKSTNDADNAFKSLEFIGSNYRFNSSGNVLVASTTTSTTTGTGALIVSGGVGIAGTLNVGGTLTQSGGYGYLGNFNGGGIFPRAGTDLAVIWNSSGGGRDAGLYNTDTAAIYSFVFNQLTGASAATQLMVIYPSGGVAIGSTSTPDPGLGSLQIRNNMFMPNITTSSSAQNGTVCWTTGTGKFTVDTTVGCLTSIGAAKNILSKPTPTDALSIVSQLEPVSFKYKDGFGDSGRYEQFGLIAEQVASVDERLAGRDTEGNLSGVRYQELTAVLVGAIQQLKTDNETLRAKIEKLTP